MKSKLSSPWAQTPSSNRREPTGSEIATGLPCGPADRALFNELFYRFSGAEAELNALISATGLTPSEADLSQLAQAISRGLYLGAVGGTVNALTATIPGGVVMPALTAGMRFSFLKALVNTGAVTLDLTGFTADPPALPVIMNDTGAALRGGEMIGRCEVFYDGAALRLVNPSSDASVRDALFPQANVINVGNFTSASGVETAFSFTGATPSGSAAIIAGLSLANALFTVPVGMGGLWYVQGYANTLISGDQPAAGHGMRLKRNGTIISSSSSSAGLLVHCQTSFLLRMADGDTCQLFNLANNAGINISTYYLSLVRLGRTS